jgi:hypothetical protein
VRWWEWLLILLAANYPAMLVSQGQPSWTKYLAYGVTTTVGVFIISGIDQRRRRRAYEEAEAPRCHARAGMTRCSPKSRDA